MSPIELAQGVLLAASFGLSLIVLAVITLIAEIVMFALGRKMPG